jgi:hypothetical protein
MTQLIVAFRNFAKAPKKHMLYVMLVVCMRPLIDMSGWQHILEARGEMDITWRHGWGFPVLWRTFKNVLLPACFIKIMATYGYVLVCLYCSWRVQARSRYRRVSLQAPRVTRKCESYLTLWRSSIVNGRVCVMSNFATCWDVTGKVAINVLRPSGNFTYDQV